MGERQRYSFSKDIQKQLLVLRQLDNWHWLLALLYDYTVIAFSIFIFYLQPWCFPIALLLIGSKQRALATLLHESAHLCLAKSRRLNRFIGTYLSGYLILQEFEAYRDSHIKQHHAYLGNPAIDPDYRYHIEQNLYMPMSRLNFFNKYILKPLLLLKSTTYFIFILRHRLNPKKHSMKNFIAIVCFWSVIFAICFYFHVVTYLMLLWFLPLITTANIFGWFNELAEHYPLMQLNKNELYMTRNRFSHWLEHFLCNTHNENYHLVHHLQASIPYWNLKKAHVVMCQDTNYAKWNASMGGTFLSGNKNPSLLRRLIMKQIINEHGQVQYE